MRKINRRSSCTIFSRSSIDRFLIADPGQHIATRERAIRKIFILSLLWAEPGSKNLGRISKNRFRISLRRGLDESLHHILREMAMGVIIPIYYVEITSHNNRMQSHYKNPTLDMIN